jgi:thymidylate synthase (FAD)
MRVIKPYAKMLPPNESAWGSFKGSDGVLLLKRIEWCARISHGSEEARTGESWEKFLKAVVIGHGDWSVVEHASVSVDFVVDRGVTHELVRHRLFSFTQSSTRFINYAKKRPPEFVYPDPENWEGWIDDPVWCHAIQTSEDAYKAKIAESWPPQKARSVFPNALASRIVVTGNLRNWRHLFIMRTTKETHPQFRQVSIPLLQEFKEKIPILFDDIQPLSRQVDNLKLPR